MNKKLITKIMIDVVMSILFILEMNLKITGFDIHEVLGLVAGIILILHLVLNFNWIKGVIKNNNKNTKTKLMLLINVLLLVSFLVMIITGIIISKFIFSFDIKDISIVRLIHKYSAYSCGIIILVHLLNHFKYLKNIMIKIFKSKEITLIKRIMLRASTAILGIVSIYAIVINLFNKETYTENIINSYIKNEIINKDNNLGGINKSKNETSKDKKEEEKEKKDEEIDNTNMNEEPEENQSKITMNEYLSKLFCTGCGRRCSLLSPRCGTGVSQAEKAKIEYNNQY